MIRLMSKLPRYSATTKPFWTDASGVTPDIHLGIERRDENYDGLWGDGSHRTGVSNSISVNVLASGFLGIKHCLPPR